MQFAQFHHLSTGYVEGSIPPRFEESNKKPIPACGSDSVYVFDGRWGLPRCCSEAHRVAKARGFIGYSIERGSSFTSAREVVKFVRIA